jgi:hypothetical protein
MTSGRQIPTALSVVSYLFLITGVLSVIEIVFSATRGAIHPNFLFLGLWIFAGLRRYSRGWRTCALVFIWISLISLTVFIGIILFDGGALWQRPSDHKLVELPLVWSLMIVVPFFILEMWQYRVLTRPDIRSLFYGESQTAA